MTSSLIRRVTAEAVGTGFLLGHLRHCAHADRVAYAVGAYITAAYWFTSSTSFANPAVTVARMFSDTFAGIAPASAPMFVAMQLAGGGLGYALIRILYPNAANLAVRVANDDQQAPRSVTA